MEDINNNSVSIVTIHSIIICQYVAMQLATNHYAYACMPIFFHITDFNILKAHYHTILHLMPDDYELTVGKLQDFISVDQICAILGSGNSTIANKIILDCLIERISCREELLDLCYQLENITASHDMKIVINEIRLGYYFYHTLKLLY